MKYLLVLFLLLPACVQRQSIPSTYSHGKCWNWDSLEKEKGWRCLTRHPYRSQVCSRKNGHKGKHHVHGVHDCLLVWE